MLRIVKDLARDEAGFIISAELVMIATVCVLGLVVGLTCLRNAVNAEMTEVSCAIRSLDQSYYYTGFHGYKCTPCGPTLKAWTAGSTNMTTEVAEFVPDYEFTPSVTPMIEERVHEPQPTPAPVAPLEVPCETVVPAPTINTPPTLSVPCETVIPTPIQAAPEFIPCPQPVISQPVFSQPCPMTVPGPSVQYVQPQYVQPVCNTPACNTPIISAPATATMGREVTRSVVRPGRSVFVHRETIRGPQGGRCETGNCGTSPCASGQCNQGGAIIAPSAPVQFVPTQPAW